MKLKECARYGSLLSLLLLLLVVSQLTTGCANAEAAKVQHVKRGEAFLKQKKYQEASIEFRNAIQIDDSHGPAHWGLARAYEGLERYLEVIDELRITIKLDAKNLDARVKLGNYYLSPEKKSADLIAEADRLANEVLAKDPNHIEGHILKGNVLLLQEQFERALFELNRAVELNPQRVETYLSFARFYLNAKDAGKAEETFKRALNINDNSSLAHREYGKFLALSNRLDEAETQFRRAVEVDPKDRDALFILASFYLVHQQIAKAEVAYKALAALEPDNPEGRATLADFYSTIGRQDETIKIYQEIAAHWPDYTRAHYRLAEVMLMRGDAAGAQAQVDEVLKKNSHDMEALLLRGRLLTQTGRSKESVEDFKAVLKQQPNHRAGLYYMAEAQFRLGQVEQARAFAGDLERYYPDYLPAKLMQAQISLGAGDTKNALRVANDLLERLSKAAPDRETSPQMLAELRSKALVARGSAELQLGDTAAARQDFQAAQTAVPRDATNYINLAAVALKEGKTDEAISVYEQALSIDSTNFDALNGLISIYAGRKQLTEAHARVDRALGSQPNNASLHFLKAQVYGYERNEQMTESELRRALDLDTNYLPAYSALGALYVKLNQQDRGIAEYRKIVERKPDDATAYVLIGMLEDSRQNREAANESYRKALELNQNAVFAANNLAWNYAEYGGGNLDEAVRLAQGVVQQFPDNAGFADTLGWVYYKKGLHGAAVEQLQKAVTLDLRDARRSSNSTPTASYRYHLGLALAGKGDRAAARRELLEALSLRDFAEANEARKALATL
ncbi:MAG: tetratricopeptide repeat protein [Pyrinomonadaceae bacterium]